MTGIELAIAFLAGVVMGIALDRWLPRRSSTPGSTACVGTDLPWRATLTDLIA